MTDQDIITTINSVATKSEKNAWMRQYRNLQKLLKTLEPIEDKILELQVKKQPIIDSIMKLRNSMLQLCIHPAEYLTVHEGIAICKFCNKKLRVSGPGPSDPDELLNEDDGEII